VMQSSSFALAWTCQDSISGIDRVEISLDGLEFEPLTNFTVWVSDLDETTTYVNLTGILEGNHSFAVRVYDSAGLTSVTMINFTVEIDDAVLGMSVTMLVVLVSVIALAVIAIAALTIFNGSRRSGGSPPA
ncbi:MAG: hypothetical protein MUO84_01650, partial [Thermoplasmata archaeon]|nr:hypothetical protein [Thermoplasmata archaeon]